MNPSALPYTVLLLLTELAVGGLVVLTIVDARGQVTRGYVKAGAMTILPLALLAAWTFAVLDPVDGIDGYTLNRTWFNPARVGLASFVLVIVAYLIVVFRERRQAGIRLGTVGSVAGVIALFSIALLVAPPAWSTWGLVGSVMAAALLLGSALMAMMWGHWYLTSGRLPKEPMEEMALLVCGAVIIQALFILLALAIPAREVPLSEGAIGVELGSNPAFWLRLSAGLTFPAVLAFLAWRTARIRGMMSATGLLYIALGLLLAGEVLARGLLFSTGQAL